MAEPLRIDWATNDKDVIAAFKRQQSEMEKERKAREELQKQINANAAADREAKKAATDAARATAAEQKRLADDAAKIAVAVRTPLQTFRNGLKDLQGHLQSGRLSNEQYRAAVDQLKQSYNEATGKTEAARKALAAENAERREAEQVVARLATRSEVYAKKLQRLNELRASGKLTADQHARAVKAEQQAMAAAAPQAQSFGSRMGEVAAGMLGANAAMAAGQKIVAVLREEYDRLIERQSKAAGSQISLAAAQESALGNLDGSMTAGDFLKQMRQLSNELQMSEKDLTTAAASALSAKGDKTAADAIQAVAAAARFKRFGSAEEQAGLAGTALDFGKAFGFSPEESLGFLAGAQKTARVVSAKGMSENIAPGIINAGKFGIDAGTSAAMAASLSAGSVDVTGAQTKTTMSSLLEQLEKFADGGGAAQGLAAVQNSRIVREEFLANASFEKQMIPAVRELLTPGTQGFREFENARGAMAALNPQQAFRDELAKKQQSEAIRIATADQAFANTVDQVSLADPRAAMSGVIRTRLRELDDQTGLKWGFQSKFGSMMRDLEGDGIQGVPAARQAVGSMAAQMAGGKAAPQSWGSWALNSINPMAAFSGAGAGAVRPATPEEMEQAKILRNLERMLELMEREMDQKQNNRQAGVAANRMVLQGEGS